MKTFWQKFVLFLFVVLLSVSCQTPEHNSVAFERNRSNPSVSQELANSIKKEVSNMVEVDNVTAVSVNNDVYLTLSVTGFDRLFLERIRKGAFDRAKKVEKTATVHVSTDRKVDMELTSLQRKIYHGNLSKTEIKKKLQKIEDDMKG